MNRDNNHFELYERFKRLENKLEQQQGKIDMLEFDNAELEKRIAEMEDDHVTILFHGCTCNNDGGDNKSCESMLHYCICTKLEKRTYNCRAESKHHKCVCSGLVVDWCLVHKEKSIENFIINNKMQTMFKDYNPKSMMKGWIARIKDVKF